MNHSVPARTDIVREKPLKSSVTIQQRQTPWARRALGLFVVVWLNMALLPCAMALEDMREHGCPHYPAAVSGQMPSHSADESYDTLPEGAPCCDVDASQCAFLDDYTFDGRIVQSKVKDAPYDVPVAIVPVIVAMPVADSVPVLPVIGDASLRPGHRLPLNVLNCVYLI